MAVTGNNRQADGLYSKYPMNAYVEGLYGPQVRIEFKFLPETLEESYSANFDNTELQGRSSPVMGYSSGGPRNLSISVTVHDDYVGGGDDIVDLANKFKSLAFPEYKNGKVEAPYVYIRFGSMLSMKAVCTDVSISWEKPYGETQNNRVAYRKAEISLTLNEVVKTAPSASNVVDNKQGGWRE